MNKNSIRNSKGIDMDLNKLTPIELHELLYKIVKKLNKLPYVYNENTKDDINFWKQQFGQ